MCIFTKMESQPLIDYFCKNLQETEEIIKKFFFEFVKKENNGAVLLLEGNLGAGKTTICQLIGKQLGIQQIINSPSFNIYNIYTNEENAFIHYDLYRITSIELEEMELRELWYDTYENKFTIHAIEWWQKAEFIESRLNIYLIRIEHKINHFIERTIKIFKHDKRYELPRIFNKP